jgi:DNA repair exonuclease SbcCD ATPase subunit
MIKTLTISGFRGVSQEVSFTLGAVTLLAGRNGLGKTTVFDAIDWCLFGPSWRLGSDADAIKNIYHQNLSPTVRMEVSLPGKTLLVERTVASAFLDGSRISDRDFVETLMTDPGGIAPYARDVERRLRRLVYLSQEDIRGLVHPDTASERTSLFQALLGVPNAAVMESGVRRIREHFRQREQELRLHLGQLRLKREELQAALHGSSSQTVDTARVVSEATQALGLPSSLTVDELAQAARRELDKLAAESIQLDEGVSSIATFVERREVNAVSADRLVQEIERSVSEESDARAAHDKAVATLTSTREMSEQRRTALGSALDLQKRLQERLSGQRRVAELIAAEGEATKALGAAEDLRERLRKDLEGFRGSSNLALDRRRGLSVRRSELQAARDRGRILKDRQREEMELVARVASLKDAIEKRRLKLESLRARLGEAREELARRKDEYDHLSKAASKSEALEALLRQAISMLPPDVTECPLCGTSFSSRAALSDHIARARAKHALTSDALGKALTASRRQEELVGEREREFQEAEKAILATEDEKSRCDIGLQQLREVIATFPTQGEAPPDDQIDAIENELKLVDEELKTSKDEIDDTMSRLGVAENDVSRVAARLSTLRQQLAEARQAIDTAVAPSELIEAQLVGAADAVRSATAAVREAGEAEAAAVEGERAKQSALQAISQKLTELRSQLVGVRKRETAESATLLGHLRVQGQGLRSVDEAVKQVEERRSEVRDRIIVLTRIWSELVAAGTEERSKAIRVQTDAVGHELTASQNGLDQLLHAGARFAQIADGLEKTAESEAADALRHQREAIQECFAAIYPHGHLNEVVVGDEPLGEILVTDGRLSAGVHPSTYLSTGQANVLGLAIFMGIALRQRLLRIGVVCLDEPVQHLDDLHFLGFVSLLKRVGLSRQVVLSTADANVAEIITRQMHSSWAELPTDFIRYDWQSFDPETGPHFAVKGRPKRAVA